MSKLQQSILVFMFLSLAAGVVPAAGPEGQAITYADFSRINYVASSASRVYFASTEGIICYNKSEQCWKDPLTGAREIDHRDILRLWVDEFDEKLVVETSLGLFEYDLFFNSWFPAGDLSDLDNHSVHIKMPRVMYPPFGYNYSADGRLIDPFGRYYVFTDVLDDGSGDLWMGTWGHGVATANSSSGIIELLPYGLIQNRVNAVMLLDEQVWVSGAVINDGRSGISVFDPGNNSFRHVESGVHHDFPAVDVNCLEGDSGMIYIGTPVGLLCLDRESEMVIHRITTRSGLPDDNVLSLEKVGDTLFVGTARGFSLFACRDDSVGFVHRDRYLSDVVYDLEVFDSSAWLATSSGAYRLLLPSGKLQKFVDPRRLLTGRVYAVEAFEHDLWFASEDGVVRLDTKSADMETYPLHMSGGDIQALAVNERIVATGSVHGLVLTYYDDERRVTREFTTADGLASNHVYSLLIDGDFIWIGSDGGLTRFLWDDPDRVD